MSHLDTAQLPPMGLEKSAAFENGQSLSDVLRSCAQMARTQQLTVGALSGTLGDRSLEVLLLVLALPMVVPIPAPGISIVFGLPMMALAAQLAFQRRHIWLPPALCRRRVGDARLAEVLERSIPTLTRLERIVRPRLPWLAGRWSRTPVGIICFVLAAIIALPVPLGHFVPGLAICFFALGLLERDGLIVGIGAFSAIAGFTLISFASAGALRFLSAWLLH